MIKKRLIIVVFLIIALFSVNVSGECIIPENGMITTQDITLCYDEYLLPYGLVISGGDVTLDCNKAKIKGYGFGEGISIIGAGNVKIINCIVENYEHGIYLEDSFNNEISNNELIENNIGIAMSNSEGNVILNNVDKSIEGAILVYDETVIEEPKTIEEEIPSEKEASAIVEEAIEEKDEKPAIEEEKGTKEEISNNLDIVSEIIPIRRVDQEITQEKVEIKKIRTIKGDKTNYEIKITAKEDIKDLVVYEYFPKTIIKHVRDIELDSKFILVEEDPIVKKKIGNIKKNETVIISYNINKVISGTTNPSSVVTIENKQGLINTLANVSYILALYLVLVLIKRYKANKVLKKLKTETKKLWGVPFPIAYVALSIIPKVNYKILVSESIAIIFYSAVILILLTIITLLIKD